MAFALLWGFPFLTVGEGRSAATAGSLLSVLTIAFICCGPVLGHLVSRHPLSRSRMALSIVAATAAMWTVVLLWPGPAPTWLLIALMVVLGVNQPGSMIGFDHARSFNPGHRLSTATGLVNMGGYTAALACILLIGVLLAVLPHPVGGYDPHALRWAFALQYPLWALGAVQILRYRHKARRAYGGRAATVATA
jgi:sugar phosphate permease